VTFTTVPLATMNYQTPTGELAVLWDKSQAAALFRWLKRDTGTAPPRGAHRSAGTTRKNSSAHHKTSRKATSSHPSTAAPGSQRTAAQDACQ
jgi:hypothetical protein